MIESVADCAHAAVHHVRRRDNVHAGASQGNAGASQQFECSVINNFVVRRDCGWRGNGSAERLRMTCAHNSAVAVRHVFAQANIADDHQLRNLALDGARRLLHDPVFRPRAGG